MNDLYLEHHGVLGQRWGIRRYQNYDGTLKNGAKGRYSNNSESSSSDFKSKAKKAAKVAGAVALAGAAAYGGYKLANNPAVRKSVSSAISKLSGKAVSDIDMTEHNKLISQIDDQIAKMSQYNKEFDRIDMLKTSNSAKVQAWDRAYENTFGKTAANATSKLEELRAERSKINKDIGQHLKEMDDVIEKGKFENVYKEVAKEMNSKNPKYHLDTKYLDAVWNEIEKPKTSKTTGIAATKISDLNTSTDINKRAQEALDNLTKLTSNQTATVNKYKNIPSNKSLETFDEQLDRIKKLYGYK